MRVIVDPYVGGANVTPSDSSLIAPTRGILASATGNIAVEFSDGSSATLSSVVAGNVYPVSVIKVLSTGTTATGILALY